VGDAIPKVPDKFEMWCSIKVSVSIESIGERD
jgi:hypothetical protein